MDFDNRQFETTHPVAPVHPRAVFECGTCRGTDPFALAHNPMCRTEVDQGR